MKLSIIIPAKNEAKSLKNWLSELIQAYPDAEVILVNDGSTDDTKQVAEQAGIKVVDHPYSLGNGAAIKTGARLATGDTFLFMDADGQHQVKDIEKLIKKYQTGYDMVVGARTKSGHASLARRFANSVYNRIAQFIVKQKIHDLTSGFRIVRANKFKGFLYLLPNGFSYPTTITMAFFRSGYSVGFTDIDVRDRFGKSHIRPIRDGIKFLLIIYKMTILYAPCKVFIPFSFLHILAACINYMYTYIHYGRFTNMSAVLLSAGIIIFLIGLVSEQITSLMYQQTNQNTHENL